jgi:hypothetical protein
MFRILSIINSGFSAQNGNPGFPEGILGKMRSPINLSPEFKTIETEPFV